MPIYSYGSFLLDRRDATSFSQKFAFDFIFKDSIQRSLDPRNDGLIPLRSQSFGRHLANLTVPHSYFGMDQNLMPYFKLNAVDLYKMHWDCLETGQSALRVGFINSGYFKIVEESSDEFSGFCDGRKFAIN